VSDALTNCDVTSGPTGVAAPGERFEAIAERHCPDGTIEQPQADARAEMYGAVARTLRRAGRARTPSQPLTVTPVVVGCATLVRFHGVLDEASAEQATERLESVAQHEPHTVLIDLALITGMDPAGAGVLIEAAAHAKATPLPWSTPEAGIDDSSKEPARRPRICPSFTASRPLSPCTARDHGKGAVRMPVATPARAQRLFFRARVGHPPGTFRSPAVGSVAGVHRR
jgi:STAS domain